MNDRDINVLFEGLHDGLFEELNRWIDDVRNVII